ncbi:MAG: hypothetical protein GX854_06135 [Clostridiales bacterium]|jgi:5'-nucleotidase|nr:hypothetical protein [Clostridiales bacterium]
MVCSATPNLGSNLGNDVLYSGTVSAAIEGCIMGIPSVAFSLAHGKTMDYTFAGQIAVEVAKIISKNKLTPSTILNVNIPNIAPEDCKGFRLTRLGQFKYKKSYEQRIDPRGKEYYWLSGQLIKEAMDLTVDIEAVRCNYVSITPLHFDLTDYDMLETLQNWGLEYACFRPDSYDNNNV